VSFLKGRSLWAVEFITVLFMLLVMILIIWGSWAHFARSFDFSAPMWSRDSSMDIAIPLWPAKILAPVAFSLLAVRLTLQLISFGKAFIYNETRPIAVPLVESAAAQAAKEASTVSG
ncbi:MAG: TRAP transporter small permease subunit, partial [Rhodobacterales bacterium]|nr:TRAP transporter small permease subunit [Rhodobacterales bacterium]